MAGGRTILRLTGAATVVAGVVITLASFWVGNASGSGAVIATILGRHLVSSWTVPSGGYTFSVFWVGIVVVILGGVASLWHPRHRQAQMEREVERQVLRERAAETDG